MVTCKDCFHFEVCIHRYKELCNGVVVDDLNHACIKFKDRNNCVEVVRCEDCIHYRKKSGVHHEDYCSILYYGSGTYRTACERDFCSYGKRRTAMTVDEAKK